MKICNYLKDKLIEEAELLLSCYLTYLKINEKFRWSCKKKKI